jgi:hypothetical protein
MCLAFSLFPTVISLFPTSVSIFPSVSVVSNLMGSSFNRGIFAYRNVRRNTEPSGKIGSKDSTNYQSTMLS